jgi:iron complex transport system substrate-binding protein
MNNTLNRRNFMKIAGVLGAMSASGYCPQIFAAPNRKVIDLSGIEVTIPAQVTKYCEDWYAHNEFDIMLNQAQGMVMTNCAADHFKWMYYVCPNMKKAIFSEGENPNFSTLVASGAQVVFSQVEDLRAKCDEVGIPMINVMFHTFDEMKKSMTLTADVFGGSAVALAQKYNKELTGVLQTLKEKTAAIPMEKRPKVLTGSSVYTFDLDGTGTIIQAWIEAAGGIQVVKGRTTGNTQAEYSLEQIIAWNPDIIITDDAGQPEKIMNDPLWASISAVKNKKVFVNPAGVFFWNRYGIEELLQLQWAAKLFHPEIFAAINIKEQVRDFYRKFLHFELSDADIENILLARNPDGSQKGSLSKAE